VLSEINKYFRTRQGKLINFDVFSSTGLYEFYGNIFGPLVYTEENTHNFIKVDKDGYMYDEIYYPYESGKKKGTIIPKMFLESNAPIVEPAAEWKNVAEKGYCVLNDIVIPESLSKQAVEESFIPHGLNPELNMSKSIFHAYFATLADYKDPEMHKYPNYMKSITEACIDQIPRPQGLIQNYLLHTADIVKYIYDPSDDGSIQGPYSYHMDYFARAFFMLFTYFSLKSPVVGRELLVGQREDFLDFSQEALDLSPAQQPAIASPFEKISDDRVSRYDKVKIDHNTVILMNTLNPMFVHRVNKLREKNEVILLTHYIWSQMWEQED
jgi:hypothetical protein